MYSLALIIFVVSEKKAFEHFPIGSNVNLCPAMAAILDFFNFYIGGHFEMAAILKILKSKSTTLSDDLFLCQVSKGSTVRFEFNIFCTLVTMATVTILIFFNPPKAATHYVDILTKVS